MFYVGQTYEQEAGKKNDFTVKALRGAVRTCGRPGPSRSKSELLV